MLTNYFQIVNHQSNLITISDEKLYNTWVTGGVAKPAAGGLAIAGGVAGEVAEAAAAGGRAAADVLSTFYVLMD